MPPQFAIDAARNGGRVPRGGYRVVVRESNRALRVSDFGRLEEAREYADDVASESDEPPAVAYVFDDRLQELRLGTVVFQYVERPEPMAGRPSPAGAP